MMDQMDQMGPEAIAALAAAVIASVALSVSLRGNHHEAMERAFGLVVDPEIARARDFVGACAEREDFTDEDRDELRRQLFMLMWTIQRVSVQIDRGNRAWTRGAADHVFLHVAQIVKAMNEAARSGGLVADQFRPSKQWTETALRAMAKQPLRRFGARHYEGPVRLVLGGQPG